MKKTNRLSRLFFAVLSIALVAALALTLTACGNTDTKQNITESETAEQTVSETGTPAAKAAELGEGKTSFNLTVTDSEGNETAFVINTDEKTVGSALQKLGLISGEEGPYGLYIKEVNGITADYDKDQTYWAFYINGQFAASGIDQTDIENGSSYGLKVEK